MSDAELRALVREALARHGGPAAAPAPSGPSGRFRAHASHALLPLVRGGDADGQCLIEPSVRCNHCGYCQSLGH